MIINRQHAPWAFFVFCCTAFCSALYVANYRPELVPFPVALPAFFGEVPPTHRSIGGTPLGLVFGSVALLIFIFAALLGARKARPLLPMGNVKFWLRAHIWLTILSIPLVCMHSGFRLGGSMTTLLVALYGIVMVSGFFGLALQQFMPRLMRERLKEEVVFEQIPHIRKQIAQDSAAMLKSLKPAGTDQKSSLVQFFVSSSRKASVALEPRLDPDTLKLIEFLERSAIPYLRAANGSSLPLGSQAKSDTEFRLLRVNVASRLHEKVDALQRYCDLRRGMDLQVRLHHWLHGWLLVHIPFSLALLILTVWHAAATLFYF